ncbi:hypothetical protein THAOC_06644 [Thalassiosira oceanica]|uniref:Uncharacterized protein n=1 Tax=Thalassiosira oceanica TaxID=159749 RepID=K0TEG2_THAOC|nr:hypothetical protein THAOC_06644 [Thalassiosira oceanica]|eukprot:EJK71876.1 hypothetical protein THAOC_06644 [Thalassiosira oceanica]
MFPLLIFLMVRTSLEHGINASSCDAFAGLGILLCGGFGNPKRGLEMARAAELILEKPGMNRIKSRTIFVCEGLIRHWTEPLRSTLDPLLRGYKIGLECGDGQSAGINLTPVIGLQNETQNETVESSTVVQTQNNLDIHIVYLISSKILMGVESRTDKNTSSLNSFEDVLVEAEKSDNQSLRGYVYTAIVELKLIFGEYEAAATATVEAGDIRPGLFANYTGVRFTFLAALAYLKAAQSSDTRERRRWKKKGLKELKLVRSWVKKGNVNLEHSLHLLEAELAVAERRRSTYIEDRYKSAIETAKVNGFIQDQALSNELASLYFASQGDVTRRGSYMKQAIDCYSEWGALAKVDQLTKREA